MANLCDLPKHVLHYVFGTFLSTKSAVKLDSASCSRICRDNILSALVSNKTYFALSSYGAKESKNFIQWCAMRGAKLTEICARSVDRSLETSKVVTVLQQSLGSLKKVHCMDPNILLALSSVIGTYNNLKILDLKGTFEPGAFGQLLTKVGSCLLDLYLEGQVAPADRQAHFFQTACPKTKHIKIKGRFNGYNMRGFGICFPNVEDLKLEGLRNVSKLGSWFTSFPRLHKLSLIDIRSLNDPMVLIIAQSCPELTCIDFQGCHDISDQSIISICDHCAKLRSLMINGNEGILTLTAATSIGERLGASLTSLSIAYCGDIAAPALRALANCTCLDELDFGGSDVTCCDALCELLLSNREALLEIGLDGVSITDDVLRCIAHDCDVHTLWIGGSTGFTAAGILDLADHATNLQDLYVGSNDRVVSELAIELMNEKYPYLLVTAVRVPDDD